jgi:myo-inositol-1(or 4)-monophosphatase
MRTVEARKGHDELKIPEGARDAAISAALDAGMILRNKLADLRTIDFKGDVDLVTDVDRASEELIADRLGELFPSIRFVGEEESSLQAAAVIQGSEYSWIVDPLDGTTNYAHGYPHFAVSIALEGGGMPLLGVVYDPMRNELFVAERGRGAMLNDEPISVSKTATVLRSLLATGFAYEIDQREENSRLWSAFLPISQGIRRDGAAALNLCYVAAGRLDGYWERPVQPWDVVAGALLVEEAGGRISGYGGTPFDPYAKEVIASNGAIHDAMEAVINCPPAGMP